jgi:hypothetical protein
MNSEFENQLQRQPMREVPPHWRARIMAAAQPAPNSWGEWLFPSPRAWAALGAAWVVIIVLHLATPDAPARRISYSGTAQSFDMLKEQQVMMAKLLGPADDNEAPAATPAEPKPRSERERRQLAG